MRRLTIRVPQVATVRQFVLTVGGLGLLSAAAWTLAMPAGLAAAGVSMLLLNWLASDPKEGRPR